MSNASVKETNTLFPVFIKLENLRLLIVGGGAVGLEKLGAVLQNSPATSVKLVATVISNDVKALAASHPTIQLVERVFHEDDLGEVDIVIVAINDSSVSKEIQQAVKARGKLVNVADQPDLCDFYLSSVVQKGNLKLAISTNGKSPTIAKRLKESFAELLPEELDQVLDNMQSIRSKLDGDFREKVKKLNEVTHVLSANGSITEKAAERHWKRIATYILFAFFFMFVGYFVLSYIAFPDIIQGARDLAFGLDSSFYWMVLTGFLAQLVDGALGMGYGAISTAILLSLGVNLPAISGSVHTAEMFSSGASGYSHYKFGNVNKQLFRVLLIPGIIGAVLGAFLLSTLGEEYSGILRPILASYTMILGVRIFINAFKKGKKERKVKRLGWLAGAGGFLDSFGGGGWGPLVTSTLISKGRSPKYVIGSVSLTEFFVTLASAVTFFGFLGISHWPIIVGLIIGGTLAAPISARLAGRLPLKTMFIAVGVMVVLWSLRILLKAIGLF